MPYKSDTSFCESTKLYLNYIFHHSYCLKSLNQVLKINVLARVIYQLYMLYLQLSGIVRFGVALSIYEGQSKITESWLIFIYWVGNFG